ncbi:MAG: hypothetical protein A2X94_08635 [Bdellovibrionales bacterium GWB1_55_8]|nr:MAG: hypothetical protein A2X94_08635 [Bdellovibrionales bacterium GWB1_55_8]
MLTILFLTALAGSLPLQTAQGASCQGVFLRQHGPTSVSPDQILSYKIQVVNEGACNLEGVQVTDYIPRRTVYREGQPTPSQVPVNSQEPRSHLPVHQVVWKDVSLPANGSTASFEVKVMVLPPGKRTITDTSCVEHPNLVRTCNTIDLWVNE